MKFLAIAALLPVLAACAGQPPQWTKAGATDEQLYMDRTNCERLASTEVQKRVSHGTGTMGPAVVGPPSGRRGNLNASPFADQFGTQQSQEDQIVRECMKEKGYERK